MGHGRRLPGYRSSPPPDEALTAALVDSDAAGLPSIAVAPNQGKMLELLAKATGAQRILEIGTLGGYSTISLARALGVDGALITLELEDKHALARAPTSNARDSATSSPCTSRSGRRFVAVIGCPKKEEPLTSSFIDAR